MRVYLIEEHRDFITDPFFRKIEAQRKELCSELATLRVLHDKKLEELTLHEKSCDNYYEYLKCSGLAKYEKSS